MGTKKSKPAQPTRWTKNKERQLEKHKARLDVLYNSILNGSAIDSEVREYKRLLVERVGQEVFLNRRKVEETLRSLGLDKWTGKRATEAVNIALSHVGDGTDWRVGFFYELEERARKLTKAGMDQLKQNPDDEAAKRNVQKGYWLQVWHNILIDAPITKSVQIHDPHYTGSNTRKIVYDALYKYISLLDSFPQHKQTVLKELHLWEIGAGEFKAGYINMPISRAGAPDDYVHVFQSSELTDFLQTINAPSKEVKSRNVKTGKLSVIQQIETSSFIMSIEEGNKISKLSSPAYHLFMLGLVHLTKNNRTYTTTPKYKVNISYSEWIGYCGYSNVTSAKKQLSKAIAELQAVVLEGVFVKYYPKKKPTQTKRRMKILGTTDNTPDVGYDLTFDPEYVDWIVNTFTMVFPSFQYMRLPASSGALLFYLFQQRQIEETKSRQPVTQIFIPVETLIENYPAIVKEADRNEKQAKAVKNDPRRVIMKPLFDALDSFRPDVEYCLCESDKRPITNTAGLALTSYSDIVESKRRYPQLKKDVVRIKFARLDGGVLV